MMVRQKKKPKREPWNSFFNHALHKEPILPTPWSCTSSLQSCEKKISVVYIIHLCHTVCWMVLGQSSQANSGVDMGIMVDLHAHRTVSPANIDGYFLHVLDKVLVLSGLFHVKSYSRNHGDIDFYS